MNWISDIKKTYLDNKLISPTKFAATLFWRKEFSSNQELLNYFKEKIPLNIYSSFFDESEDNLIPNLFDLSLVCDSNLFFNGENTEKFTLKYNGDLIVKRASDLSGAPFSQTLYAGNEIKKIICVTDFDFLNNTDLAFVKNNKSQNILFFEWLVNEKKLNEVTAKKYSNQAVKVIEAILVTNNFNINQLYGVSLKKVKEIKNFLNTNLDWIDKNQKGNNMYSAALNNYLHYLESRFIPLPKPFLLLAGISGTGKSRFVKEQARLSDPSLNNFCMLSVRPDWHEPSDLLGYVSRIPQPHYVVSEFLLFVIKAWKNAFDSANASKIVCKPSDQITPYWLCLDEMNLAPVEQYFADYLSVLETRQWDVDEYSCDPLLKASAFNFLESKDVKIEDELKHTLDLADPSFNDLWVYFKTIGIPIPPNLIVAGTVNMDETTHGFSRKVIDRALTIDFGAFFPNQLEEYFAPTTTPIALSFPVLSKVNQVDLAEVVADSNGEKSIAFLKSINGILGGTPFELAYRALNELLISVVCFKPKDEPELYAVWDDFLMTKFLPRLEGDSQKLKSKDEENKEIDILDELLNRLKKLYSSVKKDRPDLLRKNVSNDSIPIDINWRSISKLEWMNDRLKNNGFTSYWP